MAEDLLETHLYRYGPRRTLFVTGELDVATTSVFEGAVDRALDGRGDELSLDFSGLTFIDSTGARAVVHAHTRATSLGRRVVILSPTRAVRRVLDIMGLDEVVDIKDGAPALPSRFA